ncbi:amidohydrolase family protein [Roseomonas frigidaquae]|uniref:Amidohydrolase family protein n=1 Tax=Falsiroseomonas frigidaquae TaxID=487318 RepID=A0ABX1EYW3_9PROT|nr:amidohydrolase [Falsiroseomonas frigidaquae]NKE45238.1 amidohydrolase family protein [Falsiroseomonas frigidaquae]
MTDAGFDLILSDVRLEGLARDFGLRAGRIARIAPAGTLSGGPVEPGRGLLALPGLVDGHIHLDKTFLGLPWQPHQPDGSPNGSVAGRIAAERAQRAVIAEPMALRARRLVESIAARGTTAIRTHVDVDAEAGLAGLEALLELRAEVAHLVTMQIVAFPQSGVLRHARVLEDAVAAGADVVGGLDPAGIDEDIEAQLAIVFGIAERHGVPIDIHLHDPGELGAFELRRIAARSRAAGLQGRVAVSHAYALGQVAEATLARTAAALAEAGVAIMTNGPGPEAMPPVKRLVAEGVTVFVGSDNIRDAWSPYGNGDMLERARLVGYRAALLTDAELRLGLDLVTAAPARVMGLPDPALLEGAAADLVLVDAAHVPEAVATAPPRALVVKAGQIVARDGLLLR